MIREIEKKPQFIKDNHELEFLSKKINWVQLESLGLEFKNNASAIKS